MGNEKTKMLKIDKKIKYSGRVLAHQRVTLNLFVGFYDVQKSDIFPIQWNSHLNYYKI